MYATMIVVNSSRKSSTHRWTTQNRQKSPIANGDRVLHDQPDRVEQRDRQGAVEEQVRQVPAAVGRQPARRPRYMMTIQRSIPTISRYIQNRPRSRYSHPWAPKNGRSCPLSSPVVAEASPARLPTTTTTSAPSRPYESAPGPAAPGRRSAGPGRCRPPGTRRRRRTGPAAGARCGSGCRGAPAPGRGRRSCRPRRGSGRWPRRAGSGASEQGGDREEEPGGGPLGRGEGHLLRRDEPEPPLLHPVPAEQVRVPPVDRQQQADPAEQGDERQDAPDDRVLGQVVADQRLGRPVVRVRVGLAGPAGGGRPGRPGDERGDPARQSSGSGISVGPSPPAPLLAV